MWTQEKISGVVASQRSYFKTGVTLDINFRLAQLKKLKDAVVRFENELEDALNKDLGRHAVEAYFCDIGSLILEINENIKALKKWAKPETHFSGITCFPSIFTKVYKVPYGVSLIISPFNFPVLLSLGVVVASIAGGNTSVIKTSSKTPNCTEVMKKMISETFPPEYITLIDGGHDAADLCLAERFDKIFYTGSTGIGVHVMEMAAKNLTPVALELGGENGNWCVIRKDADLKDAARKIAFFKMCNSGQICINVNQVAVAEEAADEFISYLKEEFERQIGKDPVSNPEYPKLITRSAYDNCAALADEYKERIVYGGYGNPETQRYAPTVIYPVDINEPIVLKELFNPLLPVVTYKDDQVGDLLEIISSREHGLAFYVFTNDKKWAKKVMQTQQFGGGCVNEVCLHIMVKGVPFGGIGHSGMGSYHGEWGFREFTHPQTVLYGSTRFNLSLREHPYEGPGSEKKNKMLRRFEK